MLMRNIVKKATKQEFNLFLPGVSILEVFSSWWSAINTHMDICMVHIPQSLQDIRRKF